MTRPRCGPKAVLAGPLAGETGQVVYFSGYLPMVHHNDAGASATANGGLLPAATAARGQAVLTAEVQQVAQALLDEGKSVPEVAPTVQGQEREAERAYRVQLGNSERVRMKLAERGTHLGKRMAATVRERSGITVTKMDTCSHTFQLRSTISIEDFLEHAVLGNIG